MEDLPIDKIKAFVRYKTTKAISVIIDFKQYFIPDSMIHNLDELQFTIPNELQEIIVDRNFVKWKGLNGY